MIKIKSILGENLQQLDQRIQVFLDENPTIEIVSFSNGYKPNSEYLFASIIYKFDSENAKRLISEGIGITASASILNTTTSRNANITTDITGKPVKNGIMCSSNECNSELWDTEPNVFLTSYPAQKKVHCDSCGYTGIRFI